MRFVGGNRVEEEQGDEEEGQAKEEEGQELSLEADGAAGTGWGGSKSKEWGSEKERQRRGTGEVVQGKLTWDRTTGERPEAKGRGTETSGNQRRKSRRNPRVRARGLRLEAKGEESEGGQVR